MFERIKQPGPGRYNLNHKQTEKRADIGIKNFLNEADSTDVSEKIDDRGALDPNYNSILPNHMTFCYNEADRGLGKPDRKDGRWQFYDLDLDAVREQIAKDLYIGGSKLRDDQEKVKEHQELMEAIGAWIERRNNRRPEPGQYDTRKPEKHLPDIDFAKMQSREEYYDLSDEENDHEGDVLILDPRQTKDHLPGFDLAKMVGRGDDYEGDSDHAADEIIILPKPDFIKKRQGAGGAIAFDK